MLTIPEPEIARLALFVSVSLLGIIFAMIAMGAVYRASRPAFPSTPVSIYWWQEAPGALCVSRHHLGPEHEGKAAVVSFFRAGERKPLLRQPLSIRRMQKDTDGTRGPGSNEKFPGGAVCVDQQTRARLVGALGIGAEAELSSVPLVLKLRYANPFDLLFLLRDHPDLAVRVSAWIFLLTSLFGVFQAVLMQVLGY